MTPRKNRNAKAAAFPRPPNEDALKITLLRLPDPQVHLRDCSGEDECHRGGEAHDGELQRSNQRNQFAQHFQKRIDSRNAVNFGFCSSTRVGGPVSLKNQVRPSCRVQAARTRAVAPVMSTLEM